MTKKQAAQLAGTVEYTSCISTEGYDTKPFDGEAPVVELWGMWNISLLPLLPCPLSESSLYGPNRTA